jgi:hypothetical protein
LTINPGNSHKEEGKLAISNEEGRGERGEGRGKREKGKG